MKEASAALQWDGWERLEASLAKLTGEVNRCTDGLNGRKRRKRPEEVKAVAAVAGATSEKRKASAEAAGVAPPVLRAFDPNVRDLSFDRLDKVVRSRVACSVRMVPPTAAKATGAAAAEQVVKSAGQAVEGVMQYNKAELEAFIRRAGVSCNDCNGDLDSLRSRARYVLSGSLNPEKFRKAVPGGRGWTKTPRGTTTTCAGGAGGGGGGGGAERGGAATASSAVGGSGKGSGEAAAAGHVPYDVPGSVSLRRTVKGAVSFGASKAPRFKLHAKEPERSQRKAALPAPGSSSGKGGRERAGVGPSKNKKEELAELDESNVQAAYQATVKGTIGVHLMQPVKTTRGGEGSVKIAAAGKAADASAAAGGEFLSLSTTDAAVAATHRGVSMPVINPVATAKSATARISARRREQRAVRNAWSVSHADYEITRPRPTGWITKATPVVDSSQNAACQGPAAKKLGIGAALLNLVSNQRLDLAAAGEEELLAFLEESKPKISYSDCLCYESKAMRRSKLLERARYVQDGYLAVNDSSVCLRAPGVAIVRPSVWTNRRLKMTRGRQRDRREDLRDYLEAKDKSLGSALDSTASAAFALTRAVLSKELTEKERFLLRYKDKTTSYLDEASVTKALASRSSSVEHGRNRSLMDTSDHDWSTSSKPTSFKPMPFSDKCALTDAINALPLSKMKKVVDLVRANDSFTDDLDISISEFVIDIDALDTKTLRSLEAYVRVEPRVKRRVLDRSLQRQEDSFLDRSSVLNKSSFSYWGRPAEAISIAPISSYDPNSREASILHHHRQTLNGSVSGRAIGRSHSAGFYRGITAGHEQPAVAMVPAIFSKFHVANNLKVAIECHTVLEDLSNEKGCLKNVSKSMLKWRMLIQRTLERQGLPTSFKVGAVEVELLSFKNELHRVKWMAPVDWFGFNMHNRIPPVVEAMPVVSVESRVGGAVVLANGSRFENLPATTHSAGHLAERAQAANQAALANRSLGMGSRISVFSAQNVLDRDMVGVEERGKPVFLSRHRHSNLDIVVEKGKALVTFQHCTHEVRWVGATPSIAMGRVKVQTVDSKVNGVVRLGNGYSFENPGERLMVVFEDIAYDVCWLKKGRETSGTALHSVEDRVNGKVYLSSKACFLNPAWQGDTAVGGKINPIAEVSKSVKFKAKQEEKVKFRQEAVIRQAERVEARHEQQLAEEHVSLNKYNGRALFSTTPVLNQDRLSLMNVRGSLRLVYRKSPVDVKWLSGVTWFGFDMHNSRPEPGRLTQPLTLLSVNCYVRGDCVLSNGSRFENPPCVKDGKVPAKDPVATTKRIVGGLIRPVDTFKPGTTAYLLRKKSLEQKKNAAAGQLVDFQQHRQSAAGKRIRRAFIPRSPAIEVQAFSNELVHRKDNLVQLCVDAQNLSHAADELDYQAGRLTTIPKRLMAEFERNEWGSRDDFPSLSIGASGPVQAAAETGSEGGSAQPPAAATATSDDEPLSESEFAAIMAGVMAEREDAGELSWAEEGSLDRSDDDLLEFAPGSWVTALQDEELYGCSFVVNGEAYQDSQQAFDVFRTRVMHNK